MFGVFKRETLTKTIEIMNYSIKITNEELYNKTVTDVEFNNMKKYNGSFHGNVAIEVINEGWTEYDGEHGSHDYEDEFGFVIVSE